MGFITITKPALKQIAILKNDHENDVHLRIGVRQGGCSGMSYSWEGSRIGGAGLVAPTLPLLGRRPPP